MTFLTFLYVFNFNIIKNISITESSFFVAAILLFNSVKKPGYNEEVSHILGSRFNKMLFSFMTFLIGTSIIWPVIRMTFDFSYASVLVHQLIDIEIGYLLVAMFKYKNREIIEVLIDCFFIQSIIQILCFLSPTITQITDVFRPNNVIMHRTMDYTGFRGLAISGSNFFGLAVVYAIIFIVLAFYWESWNKLSYIKLLYCICMIFGALSAGRTSIIGITFFSIIMLINLLHRIGNRKVIRNIIGAILLFIFLIVIFRNRLSAYFIQYASWQRFSNYLFQFIGEDGSISLNNVSSLNHMFNNMYFKLSALQFFFGDALYTNKNGIYYMSTDVGYMRNLLFWGIFFTMILYIYQYKFIMKNVKIFKQKIIAYVLLASLAIFELKGQTMGFLIISQCLLLLIVYDLDAFITPNTSK